MVLVLKRIATLTGYETILNVWSFMTEDNCSHHCRAHPVVNIFYQELNASSFILVLPPKKKQHQIERVMEMNVIYFLFNFR